MVWIKRIFFVLAIIIVVSGHYVYNKLTDYFEKEEAEKFAKITAHTWVAAAKFNKDSTQYRIFRDSILDAENSSTAEINEYLAEYQSEPEKYVYFANLLSVYVDSLVGLEDSLLNATPAPTK